jgi:hypothetical protein
VIHIYTSERFNYIFNCMCNFESFLFGSKVYVRAGNVTLKEHVDLGRTLVCDNLFVNILGYV